MHILLALFIVLIAIIVYMFVPFAFSRWIGIGVLRRNKANSAIAFTFDDGPDPKYTGELLNLLKKYHVKATFFVVGSKAEKHPDLILRMHREGHLIGMHNYVHRSNWGMMPWTVRRDLKRTASIIEGITGKRPIYYRPPWGLLNFFDLFLAGKYKLVLWSLMVGDWRSSGGSEKIIHGILNNVKPGDIILLHDSGETWGANEDAPAYTIEGLKYVLDALQKQGHYFTRIDNMYRKKKAHMEHFSI
ncbi:polysaccharide deacetylase family protein [Bacillus sp. FJAT-49736]|uniref:polysaccharide deacetylase family protein n=1 Tax=Bacillus sp. FJAT-49736 TaxID=2833582 RepID=UPI001BC96F40|nr:polysaccharide deacetylase family protein [Bacillus sp. FJAT-49736]MBS4174077.1 polysaccharide deacetylase family protein [Bacillus sp. FJAT-49736]